ncbi:PREDICTED: dynein-1-beta heavy chain, flagellar inner arm I1 complex-like [Polistes dominula]|uniref:Dynein-1-beta heavy chain, flagellar inner arm I1 complex-like n=1 Tax=Polistes dominula TaxID=743375 RepID=A0ABM1JDK4_POLDO|nr:PREDICTED: dynein-1-beta heavy chain, flagellar inner arm I1 complex-like [Polistes dominula]
MQRRKDKVKDKPVPDPHREYLDAESSDEERGKGDEGKEVVEELRADYTREELNELVHCVKDMTTLSGLSKKDWTYQCHLIIQEFFESPKHLVLCIYYEDKRNVPTALLSFPSTPVHELCYFVRKPNEIFRLENFHDSVTFGSFNGNVEAYILGVIQNALAPVFFKIDSWPDSDFHTNIDAFLHNMTDFTYKMLGLTVIYVPTFNKDLTVEKASADKELIKRLETVVTYWTTQIKLTLIDEEETDLHELLSLDDEYEFWIYRYDNLCGLNYQLQKSTVDRIVNILLETQSTYVRQFLMLREEIQQKMLEARSNIEYLTLLREPCEELKQCTTPGGLVPILPKIIHLCRTIWLHSPFYNTTEKMANLFSALSNQIIIICENFIDLQQVFEGKTRASIEMFSDCIRACEDYKKHYLQISDAHITCTKHPWELETDYIFRHINVFIERCQDMIVICEAMIDFARMDETTNILRPKFPGTKGEEHGRACQKIERLFFESLEKIEANSHKIFDVLHVAWKNIMSIFRGEVRELEIIIENLVATVFVIMNNVQEGIENLRGFYNYMNREKLQELFNNKTMEVWKMFDDDIQNAKQDVLDKKEEYSSMMPYYSGRALALEQKANSLQATKKMMEEAEWLPYCAMKFEIFHQHEIVIKSIKDAIANLHSEWIEAAGENPRTHLDRSLIRRKEKSPLLMECNMDPFILDLCRECDSWNNLRFEIPIQLTVIYVKKDTIFFVYEGVLELIYTYNTIIEALSDMERELFRGLILRVNEKINPGLNRLTWNTDNVENFVEDCYNRTAKVYFKRFQ